MLLPKTLVPTAQPQRVSNAPALSKVGEQRQICYHRRVPALITRTSPHIVGAFSPAPYYVLFIALLDKPWQHREISPIYQTNIRLLELADWLQFVCCLPTTAFDFLSSLHRHNIGAERFARFTHATYIVNQVDLDDEDLALIEGYPAKVCFLHGGCSRDCLRRLANLRLPPIMIGNTRDTLGKIRAVGLKGWPLNREALPHVRAEIGRRFHTSPSHLRRLGLSGPFVEPAEAWEKHRGAYREEESVLKEFPCSGMRYLFPNEVLINRLRGRTLPLPPISRPDRSETVREVIDSTELVFAHKLLDRVCAYPDGQPAASQKASRVYAKKPDYPHYSKLLDLCKRSVESFPSVCGFLLCVPAINDLLLSRVLSKRISRRALQQVLKRGTDDYLTTLSKGDIRSRSDALTLSELMTFRAGEDGFLSSILGLYAVAGRIPAIRTPQLPSALYKRLGTLHHLDVADNTKEFVRVLGEYSESLWKEIPEQVRQFIERTSAPFVKLVTNLPLEWLPVRGVPLMFRTVVARLPLASGTVLANHLNNVNELLDVGKETPKILVLNCVEPQDTLHRRCPQLQRHAREWGIHVEYAEALTVREYRRLLTQHAPQILFHWGHGTYDRHNDRGYLNIGAERTEVWELDDVTVPPIIILGACETAASAPTYNTPANGWLALGTRCVLASYFRVDPKITEALLTRLFANLAEAIAGTQVLPTWALVVSKTLWLQRYIDFLNPFAEWRAKRGLRPFPGEVVFEYTFRWNEAVQETSDGYRQCLPLLRQALAHFGADYAREFDEFLENNPVIPHTMLFTHIGSPETIRIVKRNAEVDESHSISNKYWNRRRAEDASRSK